MKWYVVLKPRPNLPVPPAATAQSTGSCNMGMRQRSGPQRGAALAHRALPHSGHWNRKATGVAASKGGFRAHHVSWSREQRQQANGRLVRCLGAGAHAGDVVEILAKWRWGVQDKQ